MINIGVIGCGYWGPNIIRNFCELSESNVLMVCDLKQDRLDYIHKKYPSIKLTKNYQEILDNKEILAVCIATSVSSHYNLAKESLLKEKNVLVEKPLASSTKESLELVNLAKKKKKVLMVGHTFLYSPPVIKIKEIIKSGELGEIYYISSERINLGLHQFDVSVVWDLLPHEVSILLYWLELYPIRVIATGNSFIRKEIEDMAFVNLEFPDNILANIHISWFAPCKLRRTTIVGSKKMLVYDDLQSLEKIKIYDKGINNIKFPESFGEFQLTYREGEIRSPRVDSTEPLKIQCSHFLDCIKNNIKPLSSGEQGLEVVKILESAELSIKNKGQPIELK